MSRLLSLRKIRRFFRKNFFFFHKIKFDRFKGISYIPTSNLKFSRLRFLKVISDFKLVILRSGKNRNLNLMGNLGSGKFLVSKKVLNKYKNIMLGKSVDLKRFSKKSKKLKRALSIKTIKNFLKFLEEIKDL